MIRIERAPEVVSCPELADVRDEEVVRVREQLASGVSLSQELLKARYDVAKPALYRMQRYKCCYCESQESTHLYNTVEHYRPKVEVERHGQKGAGYWWLTWTWENLLFCCQLCNQRKGAQFPLERNSTALVAEQTPPGGELPLLLDPCNPQDDPRAHIQFRPLGDSWCPLPRNGSLRGQATLTALHMFHPELGIKRAGLVSKWRLHARPLEQKSVVEVGKALRSNSAASIQAAWQEHVTPHLITTQPFVALSLDVFEHYFDASLRQRWNLPLDPIHLDDL